MNLSSSKTKVNLMRAFAGESMARNRYNMASSQAKKDGHYAIASLFDYTAKQEQAHATVFYNHLKELTDTNFDIDASYPVNIYDNTLKHLEAAVKNEYEEYETIYQNFGDIAKEEGFEEISKTFYNIASIEKEHAERYADLLNKLNNNTLYKREEKIKWRCSHCGFVIKENSPPEKCPVCSKPKDYYTLKYKIL